MFLTIVLYFFGLLESYHVLADLYPKTFPYRFEYAQDESYYLDSQANQSQAIPPTKQDGVED